MKSGIIFLKIVTLNDPLNSNSPIYKDQLLFFQHDTNKVSQYKLFKEVAHRPQWSLKLSFIVCIFLKFLCEWRIVVHPWIISVPSNCPCIVNVEAITKAKEIKEGRKEGKSKTHNIKKKKEKIKLINIPGIPAHCYTSAFTGRKANMLLACFSFPKAQLN